MSPPCRLVETTGRWEIRNPKGELLRINLQEVFSDTHHDLGFDPGLTKDGVEADLQQLLAAHPEVLAVGLRLIRREYPTDIGPIDLLCRDSAGGTVAVELERKGETDGPQPAGRYVGVEIKRRAGMDAVEQLTRYLDRLNLDGRLSPVRGILAAQAIAPQARVLAESRGITCVVVDYDLLRGGREPDLTLF